MGRLKGPSFFILIIFFLIVLGFFITHYQILQYGKGTPALTTEVSDISTTFHLIDNIENRESLRAILVLDVSSSMRRSDPGYLQAEAVQQFYTIYESMVREIQNDNGSAQIAVVLFSTIAQVVDWNGKNQPWLNVKAGGSREAFEKVVNSYLKGAKDTSDVTDPRKGGNTDYLLALKAVNELIGNQPDPPLVIFMTDGVYEPHPCFNNDVGVNGIEERCKLDGEIIKDFREGKLRFINTLQGKEIFSVPETQSANLRQENVIHYVSDLLKKAFKLSSIDVPVFWAPILLQEPKKDATSKTRFLQDVNNLLGSPLKQQYWDHEGKVVECNNANELPKSFIDILSKWLRLKEIPISNQSQAISIPRDTKTFAVQIDMEGDVSCNHLAIKKRGNHKTIDLKGNQGYLAGVYTEDGSSDSGSIWDIPKSPDCGVVKKGGIFYRPKYDWVLAVPASYRMNGINDKIFVDLYLYSTKSKKEVDAKKIYPSGSLPEKLVGYIHESDNKSFQTLLHLQEKAMKDGSKIYAYHADIPLRNGSKRQIEIEVNLDPMKNTNVSLLRETLKLKVDLYPNVKVILKHNQGFDVNGIIIKGGLRESEKYSQLWQKVKGFF